MNAARRGSRGIVTLLMLASAACARAGDAPLEWPTRTITIIVPFKPGGGFDLQARMLAPFLEKYLANHPTVVIQNVDGAAGRMGAAQLAKSTPDGYTIGLLGLESVAFMRALGQLTEDPEEWTWLGQLTSDALLMVATTASGIRLPEDMREKEIRIGVTSEMLPSAAVLSETLGARFRPVHFDGSGDMVLAGMRGDVDALVASWPTGIKGVRDSGGKMVSLFVVKETRVPSLADVPTLAELGVQPDSGVYAVGTVSRVLVAPRGLDAAVRERLVAAIDQAARDPAFVAQMTSGGFEVVTATPVHVLDRFRTAVAEFARSTAIVKPFLD
jgi:tripartite-type tricarboxylate transporter receptor subunit TctC